MPSRRSRCTLIRSQNQVKVRLFAAQTGKSAATQTLLGTAPRECMETETLHDQLDVDDGLGRGRDAERHPGAAEDVRRAVEAVGGRRWAVGGGPYGRVLPTVIN